jgi:hypothetical protein
MFSYVSPEQRVPGRVNNFETTGFRI